LEYELPEGIIATRPAEPRDAARMMVVRRSDPGSIEHRHVRDLPTYLRAGDLMVFNRTRVLPARLIGVNEETGGKVDGLYLREAGPREGYHGTKGVAWQVLLKARRVREGTCILLIGPEELQQNQSDQSDPDGGREPETSGVRLVVLRRALGPEDDRGLGDQPDAGEGWIVGVELWVQGEQWRKLGPDETEGLLARVGHTPLPPYILASRRLLGTPVDAAEQTDRARYQTVYAREGGSVAAPTAGLHFTPELLAGLDARGIQRAEVVLHVGTGTFKPVEAERLEDHPMHTEWCSMPGDLVARLRARDPDRRVIAVGTTSVRTLESYALALEAHNSHEAGEVGGVGRVGGVPASIETRLMIRPGYRFRWTDGVMTNFHLPRSTLLALVATLFEREGEPGSGIARVRALYAEAISRGYRFYSYGDSMLILP
jgi:S-adenosylmethionine:tRNA ribosyltransferase-isomerase